MCCYPRYGLASEENHKEKEENTDATEENQVGSEAASTSNVVQSAP